MNEDQKKTTLQIVPKSIRQGSAIQVLIPHGSREKFLRVAPVSHSLIDEFRVPIRLVDGKAVAQFSLDLEGEYEIAYGHLNANLRVWPQQDLSFGLEFGLTFILIVLCLAGVGLWIRKTRTN